MFRADFYVTIRVANFNLMNSSKKLFNILNNLSVLQNVQMTIVRQNKEVHGSFCFVQLTDAVKRADLPTKVMNVIDLLAASYRAESLNSENLR